MRSEWIGAVPIAAAVVLWLAVALGVLAPLASALETLHLRAAAGATSQSTTVEEGATAEAHPAPVDGPARLPTGRRN
jgi:hypothetical protein